MAVKKIKCLNKDGLLLLGEFRLPMVKGDVIDLIRWIKSKFYLDESEAIKLISSSAELKLHIEKGRVAFVSEKELKVHNGLNFSMSKTGVINKPSSLDLEFIPSKNPVINEVIEQTKSPYEKRWAPEAGKAEKGLYTASNEVADVSFLKNKQNENKSDMEVFDKKDLNKKNKLEIESIIRSLGSIPMTTKMKDLGKGEVRAVKVAKVDLIEQVLKLQEA